MNCIVCDKIITLLDDNLNEEETVFNKKSHRQRDEKENTEFTYTEDASSFSWIEGTVSVFRVGFGSNLDGCEIVVCVCDECLEKSIKSGKSAMISNYYTTDQNEVKNLRKIWRRNNNLNKLI